MAAGNPQGSEARKLEKLAGLPELRTKLECKSRSELQSLAKIYGVAANLKSGVIIDGIIKEVDKTLDKPYDLATYKECMEAVCLLMKKPGGAKCILECVAKVEALLSTSAAAEPGVDEPAVVAKAEGNANGKIESKANEPPPNLPLAVSAVQYAPIFVVGFSSAMTNVGLQNLFDTKAIIGRFYKKRFGKPVISFAKILIPVDRIDQVLHQEYTHSVTGAKLRVAKWVESPSRAPAQAASPAAGNLRRSDRRTRSRKIPSAATVSVVSNGLIKEQANFIAKLVASQARPPGGGPHSRHGERLYSQIVAAVKTVDVRTKFLETMMREMSRLLERVPFEVGQFLHDGSL